MSYEFMIKTSKYLPGSGNSKILIQCFRKQDFVYINIQIYQIFVLENK